MIEISIQLIYNSNTNNDDTSGVGTKTQNNVASDPQYYELLVLLLLSLLSLSFILSLSRLIITIIIIIIIINTSTITRVITANYHTNNSQTKNL